MSREKERMSEARELMWRCQLATWGGDGKDGVLHFAKSEIGTFEIFDDVDAFLLHFPRALKMPAELFDNLEAAKDRARTLTNKDEDL